MVNYNNAKIYKIIPMNSDDESDVYFGSTTKEYLSQRMDTHRHENRRWKEGKRNYISSFLLFDKYGLENCKIILLENINANSKDELISRESYYIRNNKCVNKVIPDRTDSEYKKYYYYKNKENILLKKKEYDKNNKEKLKEYCKENKLRISNYHKEYQIKNREKIEEKRKVKVTCECGSICRKDGFSDHKKTKKHIDLINNQNSNPI